MSSIGPKPVRLRLDPVLYEKLRQQVLGRDGWRCQSCGTMSNLEVHHKEFRSRLGDDSEEKLDRALYDMPRRHTWHFPREFLTRLLIRLQVSALPAALDSTG